MKKAFLTFTLLLTVATMVAQVNKQQKQVLIDLYNSTNGHSWLNSWDLKGPVENWYGLTIEDNNIIAINLLFNNLHGTLPSSLGQLESLQKLELSFNRISGSIPLEIGQLLNLEILALNGTGISGNIPSELGNLRNLKQLHLSSNDLSGSVPQSLANLNMLEVFNVFDNHLTGILPVELGQFLNLKELMVAKNTFKNPHDFSIVLLSNSGAQIDLLNNTQIIVPAHSIIAVERDESDD